jgi:hypothetical protein
MLGPEQLNMVPRLSPVAMESVAVVRVSGQLARSLGLADNQVVQGVIAARNGALALLINNRELEWAAGKRFKDGDRIDFRVENSPAGRILRPVAVHHAPLSGTAAADATTSPRLLSLLYRPDQESIQSMLFRPGALQSLLAQAGDVELTQQMNQLLLNMGSLSPENIRQALVASGLFGEFLLSRQSLGRLDMKQLMRKLLAEGRLNTTLKASVSQLIDEIEGRQVDGLQAQQGQQLSYHFVLPFRDANPVEVNFERGRSQSENEPADWVINLHTDSDSLGPLWLKTTITAGLDIEMIVWAERPDAAEKAQQTSEILQNSLSEFGLTLKKITVLNAARPRIDSSMTGPGQVLDVST